MKLWPFEGEIREPSSLLSDCVRLTSHWLCCLHV